MREGIRNLSIGVVGIAALGGLAALLLAFGEMTSLFERRYAVDIALNAAGGLRQGSLVTLHGVPVGLIDSVKVASEDPTHPVRVRALVDTQVLVPESAVPTVESSLLGSGAKLELAGDGAPSSRSFDRGNVPLLVGSYKPFDQRIIDALDERLEGLRGSLKSFDNLTATYTELGLNLNDLVKPLGSDGADSSASLRTTVERMNTALKSADDAFVLAREWLADESLRADVKGAVGKANELIARATDTVNVIGGLASNLDADRAAIARKLLGVMDEADSALGDVRKLLAIATNGNGTIGRLLNDAQLYENLADSAKRLQRTLDAITAVVEKLRAEGIILKF
ncbi:MAG: MlaD family protein [Phycisphaerae bacterium]|nr:MlaD family protein [Phycisphaerae bacterium]